MQAITAQEAHNAWRTLQQYIMQNFTDDTTVETLNKIDDFLVSNRLKKLKQQKITEYFRT